MSNLSKTKKIAITGGIGSGKSTLKKILMEMNYPVFDADQYVAMLYSSNEDLIKEFRKQFPSVVDNEGINKGRLRDLLLEHPEHKEKVEAMVHPKVEEGLRNFIQANDSKIV